MLGRVLYVLGCLLVPMLWGLISYAITRAIEKRRPRPLPATNKKPMPELEYYL